MRAGRPAEALSCTRRELLLKSYLGLGGLALFDLLASDPARAADAESSANPLQVRSQHLPAKAKRCIFLFMEGGVSQMDTFDFKPALWKYAGQPIPPPRNT